MTLPHPIMPHIPQLRRYARALLRNNAAADDLVQDTLERALRKFSLWQPGTNLRAWLFSVMHNLYVNQVRAYQDYVSYDESMDVSVMGCQESKVELWDLTKALQALPPEQREVLLLVGLEGMRYEEVAQTLGVPIGTVMSRLSRARERLYGMLEGHKSKPSQKVAT